MRKAEVLMLPVLLFFFLLPACGAEKLTIGSSLSPFTLERPALAEIQNYLGLQKMESFGLSQIQGKMIIIEVMSTL